MNHNKKIGLLGIIGLALMLLIIPLLSAGCAVQISGITANELSSTMVPPVDLDVYIYVNQQVPTVVPKSLTGALNDISVQSLAIWGIANSPGQYTIAGALTFTSASDAASIYIQIPKSSEIYTRLTGSTIYFLNGSGNSLASIKNAIDTNSFKKYDDKTALAEVSKLPSGGTTKPGLIAIIKPNTTAVNMVKQYLDKSAADTVDSIFSNARPRVLALGIFGSQPVNLSDLAKRIDNDTVWGMDLGIVASMDSIYPGLVFGPIASRVIASQGFDETKIGGLKVYKYLLDPGNGKKIPIYLNISGNHVYITASGADSYAQTLMTNINR
jgi:hypothetical protein